MSTQDENGGPFHGACKASRNATLSDVARAYQLFLGRELESASIAGFHISHSTDLWSLIEIVSGCPEARDRNVFTALARMRSLHGAAQPKRDVTTANTLDELRRFSLESWREQGLGQHHASLRISEQPYAMRSGRWNVEKAIERGNAEAEDLFRMLSRFGWHVQAEGTMTVLGVESFRMLNIARREGVRIVGIEMLEPDIQLAQLALKMTDGADARFYPIGEYIDGMPETDLFYSVSALQYAPPPVMLDILRHCLASVKPGGMAAFQVPCHLYDYRFDATDYLSGDGRYASGGLNYVPQFQIISLLSEEGFRLLEIVPDERAANFGFSYCFVAEKALPDTTRPLLQPPKTP